MHLSNLKPKHRRLSAKRIGRGGKRGTTSGAGTKGQKSRAGASVRAGFRGGVKPPWQQFPKLRGASKKHGNKRPHHKHRFFSMHRTKPWSINLRSLEVFHAGDIVSPASLLAKGLVPSKGSVKILGMGDLKKKLTFTGVSLSASARAKIESAGGTIE